MQNSFLPIVCRLSLLALAALLSACGQSQHGGPAGPQPTAVTTLVLQPKTLPVSYEYVGQTTGSKEVEVRARVTGILERRLYTEGARVTAGQTLFVIDPTPFAAQTAAADAEVARAQAQLAWNNREVARLKPLAEKHAVGQKEADDAISNAELSQAALKAAEAKLTESKWMLGNTRALAPRLRRFAGAAPTSRRVASSPPTIPCSPRYRRSIRSGCRSTYPRTIS